MPHLSDEDKKHVSPVCLWPRMLKLTEQFEIKEEQGTLPRLPQQHEQLFNDITYITTGKTKHHIHCHDCAVLLLPLLHDCAVLLLQLLHDRAVLLLQLL